MSERNRDEPVGKHRALTKVQEHKASESEQSILARLKIGRAHVLSVLSVVFAALAVIGGFYLWQEIVDLQKVVFKQGGIQDVSQIRMRLQQAQSQLHATEQRLDQLAGVDAELGRVSNKLAALQGEYAELRRTTQERMQQTEQHTQNLVKDKIGILEEKINATGTEVSKSQAVITEIRDQFNSKAALMEKSQNQFQELVTKDLTQLQKVVQRTKSQRVFAEVEHYLTVASQRISIEKEVRAAQRALEAAAARLLELNKIKNLQTVLQNDIASLKAIEQPNISGIAAQITQLQAQIEDIPIQGMDKRYIIQLNTAKVAGSKEATMWDKTLAAVKEGLQQLIQIRRMNEPVMPLLAPKESYFLYVNIRLKLEAARLALLKRDQDVYLQSIKSAQAWSEKYLAHTAGYAVIDNSLRSLAQVNINPKLPVLDKALRMLQQHRLLTVSTVETARP